MTTLDPRSAVDALAASRAPYLLGVRHHSPALAAVVPALLDAARAQVVCVELPADFRPWLEHLADPETVAPVALAGAGDGGRLSFYPFADFSPELAAVRWARANGAEVVCCDLPLSDPGWSLSGTGPDGGRDAGSEPRSDGGPDAGSEPCSDGGPDGGLDEGPSRRSDGGLEARPDEGGADGGFGERADHGAEERAGKGRPSFAGALAAAGTGRAGDDLWDRAVEVLAPGCSPEAVRRAALGVGWALRADAAVPATDLAREARMRQVVAAAAADGRRVAAVIGAFHAPALLAEADTDTRADAVPGTEAGDARPTGARDDVSGAGTDGSGATRRGRAPAAPEEAVTSFVPYSFDLLDSRSGYPAGIRDPLWQQAVLTAAGDPDRIRDAAAAAVTGLCRELRRAGHTAGTGEAAETLRLACDLAALRGLPAPGRGELLEAVTTVMGQGEPLGRGRALARALEAVFVGTARGRISPHAPRSGLGPSVEDELAALRLPRPEEPEPREVRLDPLRSALDGRREVLLQRLLVIGASYGEPVAVASTGDGTALGTKWRLTWTPSVPARLDLAGVRGVTAAQAAAGTLAETARREAADGGPTPAQILTGLTAAARCDLPELVDARLREASLVLPDTADLPELLAALDLLEGIRRGHYPGTPDDARTFAGALAGDLLEAAVRSLPGLAGSDTPADAGALVALADRTAARHLGLRLDQALAELASDASPLMQGAALAVRVMLDLDPAGGLGERTAGWIDGATTPDTRRALTKRLAGVLTAAGPLLQASPEALTPLLDRVDDLADQDFLDRLPALRGGFDALAPAARDRLLTTVTDRLDDRLDLSLDAPPELLALWTAADAAGLAALKALSLTGPDAFGTPDGALDGALDTPASTAGEAPPASSIEIAAPASHAQTAAPADRTATGAAPAAPADTALATAPAAPADTASAGSPDRRLGPADRWRLLLGRHKDRLGADARRYARALDELYGSGRGEGADDADGGAPGQGGGQDASFPTAREWSQELEALFGAEVREEVLAEAADAGRSDVLTQLDPAAVRPSVELLRSVLSLAGGMPEARLARLRPLVKRLVDELARELATRLRPALSGLATPRPTRRPGGRLDLARTLRANLVHSRRTDDGRIVVVPERPVFSTRASREADWRLILVVDVSGSMEASVIWSALTAAVLGGVPTLSTHFLAFSTQVVDLTDRVEDPLSLLLEVRVGGGTHIAAGLAHARSLITVPSRTLVVVVSDFEEGAPLAGLLGEVRALASSGAHLLGCAALDDSGAPRYSVPVARRLVAAGMPVAALSPLALARWVGDRLRGEPR
ncbi:vWA domain-containing protein [Streptomyces sp. LMG1-1-1.1]|uniref:vWA domain-containing protein n=1 Tax=Streptomyces sp. LMG1-1-1.1 TaxID=3135245 RepID=UPI003467852C